MNLYEIGDLVTLTAHHDNPDIVPTVYRVMSVQELEDGGWWYGLINNLMGDMGEEHWVYCMEDKIFLGEE